MSLNWDLVLKAVALLAGALMARHQTRAVLHNPRNRLKTDLEILSLMGKDHEMYQAVKNSVDRSLINLYVPSPYDPSRRRKIVTLYGVLFALTGFVFIFWTVYLLRDGWNWWVLLTGYLGFGFMGNIFYASHIYDQTAGPSLSDLTEKRSNTRMQPTAGVGRER